MIKDSLAGLTALPCPAVYLGEKTWINDAMAKLASRKEAEEIFGSGGEKTSQLLLGGRRFAVLRSAEDPALILLSEQLPSGHGEAYREALVVRLRTALAGGLMAAELLSKQPMSERGKLQLGEIRKSMAQVERVSDNLYITSLDEAENMRALDIAALVRELFDKSNYYLPAEKAIRYEIAEGDPTVVSARSLIESLLLNLSAELLLRSSSESRLSFYLKPDERISFSFVWERPGVNADELEKLLFESEGEGTGMEAVRNAAALLGGNLFVKTQGEAAVIVLVLPREGRGLNALYSPQENYHGYDYVRMMLSDVLGRGAFAEDNRTE